MCALDIPLCVPLECGAFLEYLRLRLELAAINFALLHDRFAISTEEVLVDGRRCNQVITIVEICL